MTTPLLSIKDLNIKVKGRGTHAPDNVLVNSVSCSVNVGEVMAIIGPNGAGKSTVISAITGDIEFSGDITINKVESEPALRARQIAVLPQLSLLNFPYRVSEVVSLARIPHSTGRQRDDQIVQEALALMDIRYLSDRLYTELSGGEKQRVQLARVFAQIWQKSDAPQNTRLLLLDEPTAALDLGHQQLLMRAIRALANDGVAVVMVLHDINLAARYADKALALLCSERLAFGHIDDVITKENIKSLFGIDVHIAQHPEHNSPVVIGFIMPLCHLVLGGARSGKSRFSEQVALTTHKKFLNRKLLYVATATAGDNEMANRIKHHQERRGQEWQLVEEPLDLANVIKQAPDDTTILIDCLTLWLSNCLHQACWLERRDDFLKAIEGTSSNVVMVSNDVGSGVIPMGELSRQFVDESGWLHQKIALIASDVTLIVAGLEMPLKRALTY